MKRTLQYILLVAFAGLLSVPAIAQDKKLTEGVYAVLDTSKGKITGKLFYKKVPMTVANYVGLAEGTITHNRGAGKPFYDGLKFHRVVPNFMIQGGCPDGNGMGSPGYSFADEFHPDLKHTKAGIFSMANSGPGTNGSQFFITHTKTPHLDNRHSVFGEVIEGQDVVNKIAIGDMINSIKILRVGDDAKAFKVTQESFDGLKKAASAEKAKDAAKTLKAEMDRNKAILDKIAKAYPKAKKTDSGLYYEINTEGKGEKPKKGDIVSVHIAGSLPSGREVINTVKMGSPMEFPVGTGRIAIKAWDEGIADMKAGEKRTLFVAPHLAFGSRGMPQAGIGPSDYVIFLVELIKFASEDEHKKAKDAEALVEIKKKFPKVETTKSGLMYVVNAKGSGGKPTAGQTVSVHYVGTLLKDGKEFDNSRNRGKPIDFPLGRGRVIPGWDEGIALMEKGEKRTLIVPPELGYGPRPTGPIPANSYLVFDVELVDFK